MRCALTAAITILACTSLFASIADESTCSSRNANAAKWVREQGSIDSMGCLIAIEAYGCDANKIRSAISDALDEAARLDALLSNYKPHSEWSEMNRFAADHPVRVSAELFRLLEACQRYSRESDGAFDISVGPLMKVWGFYKGSGHLADRTQVLSALQYVGYRNIVLDPKNLTVHFLKTGVELDPGGIGKGYAVDRMVDVLRREGIYRALISAGGSSIYALGVPPNKSGWHIELKQPGDTSQSAQSVMIRDESLSTSGGYEKFFYADGRRWSHIMDPRTGYPSHGMLSVSVVAPKTIDSEAWAKPYYILGRQWAAEHKKKSFRIWMCEDQPGMSCQWVQ